MKSFRNYIQRIFNKVQSGNQGSQSDQFNWQLNLPIKQHSLFDSQLPHFLLQRLHFALQLHRFPLRRYLLPMQWHLLASQLIDWVVKLIDRASQLIGWAVILIDQASQWLDWVSQSIDQASQRLLWASQREVLYSSKGNHSQVLKSHSVINTYSITN